MSIYAIGDIQGCYSTLMRLLELIQFSENKDTLWFTGDLVNRGSESLETLRFVKKLPHQITVLGNHDLHLLAVYCLKETLKKKDTLGAILSAPDCDELCHWLCQQPFMHHDHKHNCTLVHAGIHPDWDLKTAIALANELSQVITGEQQQAYFKHMYGNEPASWDETLCGSDRWRFITNVFTRMRFITPANTLNLDYKGSIENAPPHLIPWFKFKRKINSPIIFGHWAALQCQNLGEKNIYPIDSGCVWGNHLTAMRLSDGKMFHTSSIQSR